MKSSKHRARPHLVRLGLVLGALPLIAGRCAEVARPYPAPSAAVVLAAVNKRAARVRALRGEARMGYQTAQGKIKATVRMMAAIGDRLRFDIVSPVDTPLATLVTSEGQFALIDAQKNRHFHGPASPCNLARLLRVQMRPQDILTVLGGGTPVIEHRRLTLAWDGRAGQEVLTLHGADGRRQEIRLDGRDSRWRLVRSEIRDAKGKVALAVTASDYKTINALEVPRSLEIDQPSAKASLDLEFRRQEVNIQLAAAAFERPGPEGLRSKRVTCTTAVGGH